MNIIVKLNFTYRLIFSILVMILVGIGGIALVGYTEYDHVFGIPTFFISLVVGFIFPFLVLRSIKCPRCKSRFFWDYFNQVGKNSYPNPLDCNSCPVCGYDPGEEFREREK